MALFGRLPVLALWLSNLLVVGSQEVHVKKYCFIGAGPGGIQLGHFFKEAGVDYVTWERGDHAGWFFKFYPIHRKLISLNRRNTRSSNEEFNWRHDWNSLLGVNVTRFTNWTEDYFPDAEVLVEYLKASAVEQEGKILYKHNVLSVQRSGAGFDVSVETPSGLASWQCTVVVAATGFWGGFSPKNWLLGLEHTVGYEELAPWPGGKAFDKLSVLILGNGNAAFETADAVRNYASDIGIIGRRPERLAQASHYVGDVRGPRTATLDSLELKSLDDAFHIPTEGAGEMEFFPCAAPGAGRGQHGHGWPAGKWDTELRGFRGRPPVCCLSEHDKDHYLLAAYEPDDPAVAAALERWPGDVRPDNISKTYGERHSNSRKKMGKHAPEAQQGMNEIIDRTLQVLVISKEAARRLSRDSEEFRRALPGLIETTEGLWVAHDRLLKPYDVVVRALGWRMQAEPFASLNLTLDHMQKYPRIDACFKAQDGFYFAGTLTHGYDKSKYGSAGGFIHGFRYTSKSLFQCLMHEYEGRELWGDDKTVYNWTAPPGVACSEGEDEATCTMPAAVASAVPKTVEMAKKDMAGLGNLPAQTESVYAMRQKIDSIPHWHQLVRRINEAPGPYQMSCGALVDGMVYDKAAKSVTYIQDMPLELFEDTFLNSHRVMWMFRYSSTSLADTNEPLFLRTRLSSYAQGFLHPVLLYSAPRKRVSGSSRMHVMPDRWVDFAGREDVLAIEYFMREVEKAIWDGRKPPEFHEKFDGVMATCNHHMKV